MKKCTAILLTLLTLLIGVFSALLPTTLQASADTTVYSDVLDDLEKDTTFNLQDYPAIAGNYSLQVIQVAESTTGELLLYVYQPSNGTLEKDLQASYINLAVDTSGLDFNRYSLTLLDTTSTFSKYKVNNFTVSTDTYRYYTISTIYRPWISGVDENPPVGTTIQDVSYTVGISWKTYYYNNVLSYESKSVETIDIVNPFCGTLRYNTGLSVFPFATKDSCDSHFIAFSTDRKIDKLLNAQVFYLSQDYEAVETYSGGFWYTSEKKGEIIENNILLSSDTSVSVDGIFGDTYSWYRIQSVADFKKENLSEETIEMLSDKQWVLRFLETDYTVSMGAMRREYKSTVVSEASILRLKFITDNKVYDLGAVSDVVSGDTQPDGGMSIADQVKDKIDKLWEKILQLVGIVFVVFVVVKVVMRLGGAVLKKILGWIWELFKFVIKWAFRIAFFPLWLLFGGRKKKK